MGPFACLPKENEASHIKRVFIIFWPDFFLCTVLYTIRATKMSLSERRINEKEDDFFLIEHCKILNRK